MKAIIVAKIRMLEIGEHIRVGDFCTNSLGDFIIRDTVSWREKLKKGHCKHYRVESIKEGWGE